MARNRIVFTTFVIPVILVSLYVPFRLAAQRTNVATYQSLGEPSRIDGDFGYFVAVFVWPAFLLLAGFGVQIVLLIPRARAGVRWLIGTAAVVACYLLPSFDASIGIPGGGLNGLDGFTMGPSNPISTPLISVIACPFTYLVGAICGCAISRRERKHIP